MTITLQAILKTLGLNEVNAFVVSSRTRYIFIITVLWVLVLEKDQSFHYTTTLLDYNLKRKGWTQLDHYKSI